MLKDIPSIFSLLKLMMLSTMLLMLFSCAEEKAPEPHPFQVFSGELYSRLQVQKRVELQPGQWNTHNIKWLDFKAEQDNSQYRLIMRGDWDWTGEWSDPRRVRFACILIFEYENEFFNRVPLIFVELLSDPESLQHSKDQDADMIRQQLTPNFDQLIQEIYDAQLRYEVTP